jgi:hypothetical protein
MKPAGAISYGNSTRTWREDRTTVAKHEPKNAPHEAGL